MRMSTMIVTMAIAAVSVNAGAARVWVFGDSTVDTGWYKIAPFSGDSKFDFDLMKSSTYGIGKPTNNPGPMSVEVLAHIFFDQAKPANQGGTNYATSGAKNVVVNTPLNGDFPNAIPSLTQLDDYLQHHHPGLHDLFVVSSGGNDVSYAVTSLSGQAQTSYIEDQASKLADAIRNLQHHGARFIIVANQPESFGSAAVQAGRHLYNTNLKSDLDALHVEHAWGDVNAVRQRIVATPASFNMLYTTNLAGQIACPQPNPVLGISSAWALLCSAASPVTQPTAFADQALFADDEHWASGAQKILGSYYACLAIATWRHALLHSIDFDERRLPTRCDLFPLPGVPAN
jgi:outer membrane lipase/esterase